MPCDTKGSVCLHTFKFQLNCLILGPFGSPRCPGESINGTQPLSKLTEIIRNLTKANSNKESLERWFNNILGSPCSDNLTELN